MKFVQKWYQFYCAIFGPLCTPSPANGSTERSSQWWQCIAVLDTAVGTDEDCVHFNTTCPWTECPCWSTGDRCVRSCRGMADGDYQSCRCCHGSEAYVSCSGGIFYYRPCPTNLVWNDDLKLCDYSSVTCSECVAYQPTHSDAPTTPTDCNQCLLSARKTHVVRI